MFSFAETIWVFKFGILIFKERNPSDNSLREPFAVKCIDEQLQNFVIKSRLNLHVIFQIFRPAILKTDEIRCQ